MIIIKQIRQYHMSALKPLKIFDKKFQEGEEHYLIQMLGEHQLNAKWVSKASIELNHPQHMELLEEYDQQLDRRCRQLKSIQEMSIIKKKNVSQSEEDSQSEKEDKSKTRQRKLKLRLRHKKQIFEQGKKEVKEKRGSYIVPAQDFVIYIKTPFKTQNHWAYGDSIATILSKEKGTDQYKVEWEDKTTSVVKQKQLKERETVKFCQFWQQQLNLLKKCGPSNR